MLLRACNRCGNLIPYGESYCSVCKPIHEQEKALYLAQSKKDSNKRYNQTRDKKYIQFYNSSAWKMLASRYTQDKQYKCESCGKIATQVHHKEAIQTDEGWKRRLDYNNLELLCTDCHNQRHNRFKRREKRSKD